jgi:hypothetical protein
MIGDGPLQGERKTNEPDVKTFQSVNAQRATPNLLMPPRDLRLRPTRPALVGGPEARGPSLDASRLSHFAYLLLAPHMKGRCLLPNSTI